jgi:hypothetical protein
VIKAHSGLDRWDKVRSIDLNFNFSGQYLAAKGWPGKYTPTVTVSAKEPRSVILQFDPKNQHDRWIYTPNRTSIESEDGTAVSALDSPRSAFAGYVRATPWDELHLMYFVGYAMHNYLTAPFHFTRPGFQTREVDPHTENGDVWRALEVTFPDDYPTHNKTQWFYFDEKSFMLQRVDYKPDVVGAAASHYCYDHKEINGIMFPTLRRVVIRVPDAGRGDDLGGKPLLNGPTAFLLDYRNIVVHDE